MTYKNTKTILFASLIAAMSLVLVASTSEVADAVTFGNWESSSQSYYCTTSLDDLDHTSNVEPCSDLSMAAGVWNDVGDSTWELTSSTSSGVPDTCCH